MKKNLFVLLIFFISLKLFSYGGVMSGEKSLKTFSTKYFDLIFPVECEQTALKIAKVCDNYYLEISEKLGLKPYQRFPVTITRQVESANAYFSMAPYNMIVFYDTDFDENLDMYEDTVESIFYHELTHAVTLNAKSPLWQAMSMYGDFFTPAGLSLTSFWFEGAAVLFESLGEGGRLNDPFFTQIAVEAKIKDYTKEKRFPSWRDVSGARDTYPYGNDAYAFGASFAEYLVKTYGFEKYALFWKNAGTSTNLSFCAGVFKKTYGIELSNVWLDFKESIVLPANMDIEGRKNFVSTKNLISKKGSAVHALDSFYDKTTGQIKLVWYDTLSNAVYLDGKKLFSAFSVQSLKFSEDGKKLFVNALVHRSNIKSEDFEYDFANKKRVRLKRDKERFEKVFGAQIKKEGLNWSVLYSPSSSGKKARYDFKGKILHNLHLEKETEDEISFLFTWAQLKTSMLSRVGRLVIDKNTLKATSYLQSEDNYAGILDCVPYGTGYALVTQEFYSKPLRKLEVNKDKWIAFYPETLIIDRVDDFAVETKPLDETQKEAKLPEQIEGQIVFKDYKSTAHFFKGIKFPFSVVEGYKSDFSVPVIAPLGFTFISSTPWMDKFTVLSVGGDLFTPFGGLFASVKGGDDLFSYDFSQTVNFYEDGFLQSYSSSNLSLIFWRGLITRASVGLSGQVFFGNEVANTEVTIVYENPLNPPLKDEGFYGGLNADVKFFVQYSSVHKASCKYLNYSGAYIKPFVDFEYDDLFFEGKTAGKIDFEKTKYANLGLEYGIKILGFFPLSFEQSFFPQKNYFTKFSLSSLLWSTEIQKGIPALSVYAYRINLKALYAGALKYDSKENFEFTETSSIAKKMQKDNYTDLLRLSGEIVFGPGTSYFANGSNSVTFGGYLQYKFYGEDKRKLVASFYTNLAW